MSSTPPTSLGGQGAAASKDSSSPGNYTSAGDQQRAQRAPEDRPAWCLTTQLLATYKAANESYYSEKRLAYATAVQNQGGVAVQNQGFDDEHGNYIVQLGEELHGRFLVKEVMGRGSFGVVVKAFDQRREELVAVKIIRNRAPFATQALSEISILTELNQETSESDCIVRLRKYFSWQSHLCLVFELLSFNLYDLIKFTRFAGVSIALVRKFGLQLTKALSALRSLKVPVIHGDLKPENILLKNAKRSSIKVIDFGSACYATRTIYHYIQSRYYRSPEVILGLPYDCGIDTWSLACILIELYIGRPLFPGRSELEQLSHMRDLLGDIPQSMILQSPKRVQFYRQASDGKWLLKEAEEEEPSNRVPAATTTAAAAAVGGKGGGGGGGYQGTSSSSELHYNAASSIPLSENGFGGGDSAAAGGGGKGKTVHVDVAAGLVPSTAAATTTAASGTTAATDSLFNLRDGGNRPTMHTPEAVKHQLLNLLAGSKAAATAAADAQAMSEGTPLPSAAAAKSSSATTAGTTAAAAEERQMLVDLLEGMLRYSTSLRTTPADWVKDPFFQQSGANGLPAQPQQQPQQQQTAERAEPKAGPHAGGGEPS